MSDLPPITEEQGECVTRMASSIRRVITIEVAAHGQDDPLINDMVGSALVLAIIELTANVDPGMTALVITMLGGTPFVPTH